MLFPKPLVKQTKETASGSGVGTEELPSECSALRLLCKTTFRRDEAIVRTFMPACTDR